MENIIKVLKKREDAVLPTRAHSTDSGWDLTVVDIYKKIGDVTLYDTGIVVQPPEGYHTEIFPRSSISKTGYMLANSIGLVDQSYLGTILIALRKVDGNSPDIELPCKIAQLVLRKREDATMELVEDLEDTERGAGGFGSTG